MRTWLKLLVVTSLAALPAVAAEPPPVRLIVKPLLCVVEKATDSCNVMFDIRWKSVLPGEYCLSDETIAEPLRCWPRALSGELQHQREVSEEFIFWLAPPEGAEHAAEVKVEVLRVGSDDRRRERRSRHVWDVL